MFFVVYIVCCLYVVHYEIFLNSFMSSQTSTSSSQVLLRCPICADHKVYKGQRGLNIHLSRSHIPRVDAPSSQQRSPGVGGDGAGGTPGSTTFSAHLAQLKHSVTVIKRIPKAARHTVARSLSEHIAKVVATNDQASWEALLPIQGITI